MAGEIEAYLTARFAFEERRIEVNLAADEIMRIGALIKKDPARIAFSGTSVSLQEGSFTGQTYPGSDWKSAEELQRLLSSYHDARFALRSAWAVVPLHLKGGLQPPPSGVLPPQRFDKDENA